MVFAVDRLVVIDRQRVQNFVFGRTIADGTVTLIGDLQTR